MNNTPLVSVVMAVFNGEKYLSEAVESILHQSYRNFEFIIINDGSTDSSLLVLEAYKKQDRRIKVISHENRGLASCLNEAISVAKGKYIARMDADDISLISRLKTQVEYMEANSDVVLTGMWARIIYEKKISMTKFLYRRIQHPKNYQQILFRNIFRCSIVHPTVMLRKEIFQKGYKYKESLKSAQDYDLWVRISKDNKIENIPITGIKHRVHPTSISMQQTEQQQKNSMPSRLRALEIVRGDKDLNDYLAQILGNIMSANEYIRVSNYLFDSLNQFEKDLCVYYEWRIACNNASLGASIFLNYFKRNKFSSLSKTCSLFILCLLRKNL